MNFVTLINIATESNNIVFLDEADSEGVHWTYKIELLENYSSLTLVDGSTKYTDPECKFIERTGAGMEVEDLGNMKRKLLHGYSNIRYKLKITDLPSKPIQAIVRNTAGEYLIDLILQSS
jgi:hypothetical protein